MPSDNLKKILSGVLILAALFSILFGSILPLAKSHSYITYLNSIVSARTTQDFESLARNSLDMYSPIGQEEVTKFILSGIRDILNNPNVPTAIAEEIVHFIEPYAFKDDVRHLAAMGDLYTLLWGKYGDEAAYGTAVDYYKKALVIGPNLPPMLYALLELYSYKKDFVNVKQTADVILKNWPNDNTVRDLVNAIPSSTPALAK